MHETDINSQYAAVSEIIDFAKITWLTQILSYESTYWRNQMHIDFSIRRIFDKSSTNKTEYTS